MKKSVLTLSLSMATLMGAIAPAWGQNPAMSASDEHNVDGTVYSGPSAPVSHSSFTPYKSLGRGVDGIDLVAFLVTSNNSKYPKGYMYSLGATAQDITPACGSPMDAEKGFCQAGDKIYAVRQDVWGSYSRFPYSLGYNRTGWYQSLPSNAMAEVTAQDPVTGTVYGVTVHGSDYYFSTIDYEGCTVNEIKQYTSTVNRPYAMGVTNDNRVFAVCRSGKLVRIDPATGETTDIGDTGLTSSASTGCIDPESNRFFVIVNSQGKSALYEINTETAQPTLIYDLTNTVKGNWASMHVPFTPRKDKEELTLPYTHRFDQNSNFMDSYWVYNLNDDERYWRYSGDYMMADRVNRYQGAGLPTANAWDNETNNNDWLVSPKFHVEKGKIYEISVDANCLQDPKASTDYKEELALYVGTDRNPAAMTTCLVPTTEITQTINSDPQRLTGYYTAPDDGDAYLGVFEGGPYSSFVFVHTINISQGQSSKMPQQSTITAIEPAEDANTAVVTVTTPTLDMTGSNIQEKLTVELMRDRQVVATKQNVEPGATVQFEDAVDTASVYTYIARSSVTEAMGRVSESKQAFLGVDIPGAPLNVQVTEAEQGVAKIAWQQPETGKSGFPMNTKNFTYNIVDGAGTTIAEGLKDISFTQTVCPADSQAMTDYRVIALTQAGAGEQAVPGPVPVGQALTFPLRESFSNSAASIPWGWKIVGNWSNFFIHSDPSGGEIGVDGDNGFFMGGNVYGRGTYSFTTAKVKVPEGGNPTLSFFIKNFGTSSAPENEKLVVKALSNGQSTTLLNSTVATISNYNDGWNRVKISLGSLKGQEIYLNFAMSENVYIYTYYDTFSFDTDSYTSDVALSYLNVVDDEETGNYNVTVTVFNQGDEATPFEMSLTLGDTPIAQEKSNSLAKTAYKQFTYTITKSSVTQPTPLTAKVTNLVDQYLGNNERTITLGAQSGINGVNAAGKAETARYGIDGRQLSNDAQGFMIIRYNDGSAAKVVK